MGVLSQVKKKLLVFEGKIPHMYCDSKGLVTVGIGHLIKTPAMAKKLSFVTKDGSKATAAEIEAEHAAIKKAGKGAKGSKKIATLTLPNSAIDACLDAKLREFKAQLVKIYPKFNSFPGPAQAALYDMIYGLGAGKVKNMFKNFTAAVLAEDWAKAAAESKRKGSNPKRNEYVKAQLLKAAKASKKNPIEEMVSGALGKVGEFLTDLQKSAKGRAAGKKGAKKEAKGGQQAPAGP